MSAKRGLKWCSSLQGPLGEGPFVRRRLSTGHHRLRFVATDSDGNSSEAAVEIEVRPAKRP